MFKSVCVHFWLHRLLWCTLKVVEIRKGKCFRKWEVENVGVSKVSVPPLTWTVSVTSWGQEPWNTVHSRWPKLTRKVCLTIPNCKLQLHTLCFGRQAPNCKASSRGTPKNSSERRKNNCEARNDCTTDLEIIHLCKRCACNWKIDSLTILARKWRSGSTLWRLPERPVKQMCCV